ESDAEHAYRLILDEVPNIISNPGSAVQTALRASVPVFLTPSIGAHPQLRWTVERTANALVVTAFNDGPAHERLANLSITANGQPLVSGAAAYVLSHGKRTWTFANAPADATAIDVVSEGVAGPVRAHASVTH